WPTFRKAALERRAAISIVCRPKFTSMRSNDGTADRQAQAHSLRFCGEERLENLFGFFLRNAATSVGDGHYHCAASVLDSRTNDQPSLRSVATSHRVTSINYQVK